MTRPIDFLRALGWRTSTWLALTAAFVATAGAAAALAVTTEDVTQHNGLSTSDPSHLRFFIDHRSELLVDLAKLVTELGAAPLLAVLALATAFVLWWRGARVIVSVAPMIALGLAGVAASVAKQLVGRSRPPMALRLVSETEPSFPSGHATDSAAFYVALGLIVAVFVLRRPLSRVLAVAGGFVIAGCIGLSRLILGVHWPSDVVAGWALGTTTALVVVLATTGLSRVTPPSNEGARLRSRLLHLLHARRPLGLRAV